jgi:predicted peptidase
MINFDLWFMHKHLRVLVLFLLALAFTVAPNTRVHSQNKTKAKYKYLLYLPKTYSAGKKKYPLVIYLHGGSQRGNDLSKLKGYGLPGLVSKGKDFPFIIASPQCPADRYWSTENWFDSLYEELVSKYRIDTNRVYLTGISIGGFGTYITAMDHPDKFAALVALCGGCNDADTPRICSLSHIPIWAFHGTADNKIPISETERIVRGLQNCRGDIRFTRIPGAGHGIEYLYETKPEIYSWMLRHRRKSRL